MVVDFLIDGGRCGYILGGYGWLVVAGDVSWWWDFRVLVAGREFFWMLVGGGWSIYFG